MISILKKLKKLVLFAVLIFSGRTCFAQGTRTNVAQFIQGTWTGVYDGVTTTANFTNNRMLIRVDGNPIASSYHLDQTGTVLLLSIDKALSAGISLDLDLYNESETNIYYPISITLDGNLLINDVVYTGLTKFTSLSDLYGTFTSTIGEYIQFKEGGKFLITDDENNAYSGKYTILPSYNLVFYCNGKETKYELIPANDFILLSGILMRK